jgi:hypothetical protein
VTITQNRFNKNLGVFGGAITINSPKWVNGKVPSLYIGYNTFDGNMAYVSGNAVYIRLAKSSENDTCKTPGLFSNNNFNNNLGLKLHNGGAVTVRCTVVNESHDDY